MSELRWPPPEPEAPPFDDWPLWTPRDLRGIDLGGLSYIVVDEIVEPTCVLAVTEWPRVDDRGRVRFRLDNRANLVRVAVAELTANLGEHRYRRSRRGPDRAVRIGDVYAASADTSKLPPPETEQESKELAGSELTPLDWLRPPVYDITGGARDVAKAALYSAVAPVLRPSELKRIAKQA